MNMRLAAALVLLLGIQNPSHGQDFSEKNGIERLITETYLVPVYLKTNLEIIKTGFHEKFSMYVLANNEFSIRSRDEWIERLKKAREQETKKNTYAWLFELIDVEDQTAMVKIRITENGELKYVDFLTLYKFKDGWKVITKQFTTY